MKNEPTPLAVRTTLRHVSRRTSTLVEVVTLRRPEVTLSRTDYRGLVVDERLLTEAFPWVQPATPRLSALIVLRGRVRWEGLALAPLDAALFRAEHEGIARFEDALYLDIRWVATREEHAALSGPRALRPLARAPLEALARAFDDESLPQRELYARAFRVFRDAGAPLGELAAETMQGSPSERDQRIASAIEGQLASLATRADANTLGELAELSPRQLQRVLTEYAERYALSSGKWRDIRNRFRLQIAAVLLSVEDVSVAEVAAEVGYASAPALARAFASVGFASPTEVRRRLRTLRDEDLFRTDSTKEAARPSNTP